MPRAYAECLQGDDDGRGSVARRYAVLQAERNGQPFAWVSVDEADNDPKVLLSYVAEALDAVQPIGERLCSNKISIGE